MILLNERYASKLKRVIDLSTRRLYISQFKIDVAGVRGKGIVSELLNLIAKKSAEGVDVRVILDCILPLRGRAANNAGVAIWLMARGIGVRYLPRNRCQHSKVVVADGYHLIIGSHNWSRNSLTRNDECSIYLYDAKLAGEMEANFLNTYDGACEFGGRMIPV